MSNDNTLADDHFFDKKDCDRCRGELLSRTTSWFTEETICMTCKGNEDALRSEMRANGVDVRKLEGCGYIPNNKGLRQEEKSDSPTIDPDHSANCHGCNNEVDERQCVRDAEGSEICPACSPKLCIRVEWDPAFFGGGYSDVGQFAYVPVSLIDAFGGDVDLAFGKVTHQDPIHIIHYTLDEVYYPEEEDVGKDTGLFSGVIGRELTLPEQKAFDAICPPEEASDPRVCKCTPAQLTQFELEEKILELIYEWEEYTTSDLQGCVSAIVMKALKGKKEMLEALEMVLGADGDLNAIDFEQIRSAIAKATS